MDTKDLSNQDATNEASQRSSVVEQFFRKEEVVGPTPTVGSPDTTGGRMSKRLEKEARRNLIYAVGGIFIIIALLVIFGIPLFIKFTDFIGQTKEESSEESQNIDATIIAPPLLDQTYEATNSARVKISGVGLEKQEITLYINDEIAEKVKTKEDGTFEFKNVELNEGQNIIKAKAGTDKGKKSNYSRDIRILYLKNPPNLSIDSPPEGQLFAKDERTAVVTGKTDSNVKVTVNGLRAVVDNSGKYSYSLQLKDGENEIRVKASDMAGNSKEEIRKVTYSP